MKELVKPIKNEKEHNDAQMYCEGGNYQSGCFGFCGSYVHCDSYVGYGTCNNLTFDKDEDDILF